MDHQNQQPERSDRARRTRQVGRLRAALVGGAVATSLAATGAIVAVSQDGATQGTASSSTGTSSTSASSDSSTSQSSTGQSSSTSSSLATTGSGDSHATSSGS